MTLPVSIDVPGSRSNSRCGTSADPDLECRRDACDGRHNGNRILPGNRQRVARPEVQAGSGPVKQVSKLQLQTELIVVVPIDPAPSS